MGCFGLEYENSMKKTSIIIISLLVVIAAGLLFLPEEKSPDNTGLWENAVYTENTTLGTGENTFEVTVEAGGQSVEFTIKTDKTVVGDALKEHNLIDGEEGPYGLYVKVVNGIEADYDKDQSYWSFEKDGEAMLTGVDSTELKNGDRYTLVRTK